MRHKGRVDHRKDVINLDESRLSTIARIEESLSALAESRNASVVRKHMGYSHIPRQHAGLINTFYQEVFNPGIGRPSCACLIRKILRLLHHGSAESISTNAIRHGTLPRLIQA